MTTVNTTLNRVKIGAVILEFVDALTLDTDLDIQIGVDEVYLGDQFMGGAQFGLVADDDKFHIQPMKVSMPSGDIDVEYSVERVDDGYDASLSVYIERLQYADWTRFLDPNTPPNLRGHLYLDTKITASAPSVLQLTSAAKR